MRTKIKFADKKILMFVLDSFEPSLILFFDILVKLDIYNCINNTNIKFNNI